MRQFSSPNLPFPTPANSLVSQSPGPSQEPVFEKILVWSVSDVARELKLSRSHIYRLISQDKIPYAKVGRLVRFYPERVYEWLSKGGTR